MAKLQLKGILGSVSAVYEVGTEKKILKQSFTLLVPGYVDQFGDKKGNDEWWKIDIIGQDAIDKFRLPQSENLGKKAICDLWINSSYVEAKNDKPEMFFIQAVLSGLTFKE